MFIRIKKIKGKEYAYLVKNTWKKRKKSSRQTSSSYLGKVIKLKKTNNKSLLEFLNLKDINKYLKSPYNKIILDLLKLELFNHSFTQTNKNIWTKDNTLIDFKNQKVSDLSTKKPLCLEINNNFLCSYTIRKLMNFKPKPNLTEIQIGKQLATTIESSGVLISKEIFVTLAQKILKEVKK